MRKYYFIFSILLFPFFSSSQIDISKIGNKIINSNSKKSEMFKLTRKDLFLALAKDIPAGEGKLQPNPHKTWKDVNSSLPAVKIEVLGPPPTSGTRDAFAELGLEGGCKKFKWIKAMKKGDKALGIKKDKKAYKRLCHTVREDGAYIEAGENDNMIISKLEANPKALGIVPKKRDVIAMFISQLKPIKLR